MGRIRNKRRRPTILGGIMSKETNEYFEKRRKELFAFEQRLHTKMFDWICKYAGVDPKSPSASEFILNYLANKWSIYRSTARSFVYDGSIPRDVLYTTIERGFDICTEMNIRIVLYD